MRIADLVEGQVAVAMETVSDEQAVVFMFTKGREVQFTIGVGSAKFEQLDAQPG
jgi:hypothetical protein